MTGFFISDWKFSDDARRQLGSKLPPIAVGDLESELNEAHSLWSARPPTRREQIASIKKIRERLAKIGDAFSSVDDWVADEIQFTAGRQAIPFRDLLPALAAYSFAAERAEQRLANAGPKAGSDPEWPRMVVRAIRRIFAKYDLPIGDATDSAFVHVIEIAFRELGIAYSEPRALARAVVSGKF
jgi:hypothetical protein